MEHSLFYLTDFVVTPSLHLKKRCLIQLCREAENNERLFRKKNNFNVKTFKQ